MILSRNLSLMQKFVLALLLTTIVVVGLYLKYGQAKSFILKPTDYGFVPTDDRQEGGASISSLAALEESVEVNCELKASDYPWPYCSFSVYFDQDHSKGFDFSNIHTLYLDIDYKTLQPNPRLRIYLRNFNPAYSTLDNEYTIKYNGLEYAPGNGNGEIAIPLKNFQVMTWWLSDLSIPIKHAGPEFSNVVFFEVATGSGAKIGPHELVVNSIRFEGSYVDGESLLFALLVSWIVLGIFYTVEETKRSQKKIARANARQIHLQAVNDSLRLQNHEFSEMAQRDALTGARNRHSVRSWLDSMTKSARWNDDRFSMIYLDIDHFKNVNDTFGHQVGDDILREFVMIVTASIQPDDHLVRWGGEEFIVFCPHTSLLEAKALAEKTLVNVKRHIWVHGEELTCSAGVAEMGEERVTETIARADEALYAAKQNGRDRVEVNFGLVVNPESKEA